MIGISLRRVIKSGFLSFWRNGFISFSSVLVMTVSLFAIGSLLFSNILVNVSLNELKDKVDINVYFVTSATEQDVLDFKQQLLKLPEVKAVDYISREDALEIFKKRHENDYITLQSLEELNKNPLGATLNIRAQDISQYETIAKFLEAKSALTSGEGEMIDSINYHRNKAAIDRLISIIDSSKKSNFAKTMVLLVVSILIVFNTIRLAIYNSREEIGVMRLVGASNFQIRGPFVFEGIVNGLVSSLVVLITFYPVTLWLGPLFYPFSSFSDLQSIDLLGYYVRNFPQFVVLIVSSGVLLGVVSSYLAVRRYISKKYLKI